MGLGTRLILVLDNNYSEYIGSISRHYYGTTRKQYASCANYYLQFLYIGSLYSIIHPMKYVESDVMWYEEIYGTCYYPVIPSTPSV